VKLRSMLAGALASAFLTLLLAGTASAAVHIVNDPGGEISSYLLAFKKMRCSRGACRHRRAMPVGVHVIYRHCAAQSRLRHQTCSIGFPRRVLLQRCFGLASADEGRH